MGYVSHGTLDTVVCASMRLFVPYTFFAYHYLAVACFALSITAISYHANCGDYLGCLCRLVHHYTFCSSSAKNMSKSLAVVPESENIKDGDIESAGRFVVRLIVEPS